MNQDYETSKNTGGQMTPATVKQSAARASHRRAKAGNTDAILDRSMDRQQSRANSERKAAAAKSGKIAMIFEVVKYLGHRGLVNALGVWQHISLNGKTPRPATQDEFRLLMIEMIHAGSLQMTGGTPDSPLTKIFCVRSNTKLTDLHHANDTHIESPEPENLNRLRAVGCTSCSTIFAVPSNVVLDRLHECGFLYCPSGHIVHLENDSENTGDLFRSTFRF